ncbi:alpha/beta hydrolase [Halomicrobium sp. IBSBa]|uniref:alpha/beta fold hydrolase n=1 Tax=Halomicrobium sp. IBSBa TaxID=2778916 RepID=UPI001ABEF538|nr:alpha/beta hydrolase [Halomicrobium sp. IBSBa]MBO4247801.1 alpha/beta hydrolase [Halomicrobium sp. IBSBa]
MNESIESNATTLSVDGDDVTVRYLTAGDGPPLLFLHGIGLDAAAVSGRYALPALAEEYTVYALDFPGHGESEKPRRTYTTDYYVDTLSAFVDELAISGASVVGVSMGGAVALGHALDGGRPERLVLVDSYGLGADAYWRTGASLALRVPFADSLLWGSMGSRAAVRTSLRTMSGATLPDELVDDVYETISPATMRTLRSWQRHEFQADGLRTDYTARLSELDVPTLLVHGSEDPLLPVSWSERASELLPDGQFLAAKGCGHWPHRERPERFNRAVTAFLNSNN